MSQAPESEEAAGNPHGRIGPAIEILESMPDGYIALDPGGRFTYANGEARRLLGRDDLLGRVLWEAYPDLAGTDFERACRTAMAQREPASAVAHDASHDRWYEAWARPTAGGICVYFRDVTSRVLAEGEQRRLIEQSERQRRIYEAALSNTPDLVYVFDLDHRFTYANEALLKMWGRTREDALGKNCLELGYEPWHAQMHDRELEQVVATRKPIRGEVPFTGTNGRRIYDYIFVPVLGPDGAVVAVAGTTRDVTERKQNEQAVREQARQLRESDRAKDEFLAMLSHELRNPLAPLRNALSLLRMGVGAEQAARLQGMMERQVVHLVRLVDDLLEVSRLSRGEFALRKEHVDLGEVVRNALETAQPAIQSAGHAIDLRLPEEPIPLLADPVRLSQVISNLLDNAAKYTPQRGRIGLTVAREDDFVEIAIEDDGMGIEPELLPRMFEMFTRGQRATLHAHGGLGIGLALARRLIEMHGGELSGHSEGPGKGSRFHLRLPAGGPAQAAPEAGERGAEPLGQSVLVVDDNVDAAESLGMILGLLGAEVFVARDGAEALDAFARHDPSIVVLDLGMPGIDGIAVANAIRSRFPERKPALIALTGWAQEEDLERTRQAGFHYHLVKPVEVDALRKVLGAVEGGRASPHVPAGRTVATGAGVG